MAVTATKLNAVNNTLIPRSIVGPIFERAVEQSAIMSLGRQVPLSVNAETAIPVLGEIPIAGWVGEGERKPVGSTSIGVRTMTGKKVALVVPISEEVVMTNPAGLFDELQRVLPTSISRAFDAAAIHGKDLRTGGAGPFADYLTKTSKQVVLGTATKTNGGLYADLVDAERQLVENDYDLSGFVVDPRLSPTLKLATDNNGRPLFVGADASANTGVAVDGSLLGFPSARTKAVSGKLLRRAGATDTGLRAIAGDWSQVAFGVGMDMRIKTSTEGTYIDPDGTVHSAFQENLVLLLVEAYYGMIIGDTNAFVKVYASGQAPAATPAT